eukprot:1114618_1
MADSLILVVCICILASVVVLVKLLLMAAHQMLCHPSQRALDLETTKYQPRKVKKRQQKYPRYSTKSKRERVTYNLEEGWLESLCCRDEVYVYDEDTDSWEIGKVIEKTERDYKTQTKYVLKIRVCGYQMKYFIWVTVNQFATTSSKIRKFRSLKPKATIKHGKDIHHKTERRYTCFCKGYRKICIRCKRKCCYECFLVQITKNRFICHDCVVIVASKHALYDIISSNFKTKQKNMCKYFIIQGNKAYNHRHKWTNDCVFCKEEYCYREGLYAFGYTDIRGGLSSFIKMDTPIFVEDLIMRKYPPISWREP